MTHLPKIDKPPAAEHWSRMQHPDVQRTARKLFAFLRGSVTWNYGPCRKVAKYYIEDGISREVGIKIASENGSPNGRDFNIAGVNAFFDFVETYPIVGLRAFSDFVEWFPIAPGAAVPIRPISITRESGFFVPNFVNFWSGIPFDDYQASLFMTILEKSIFRQTDFENSPGRIIFLPKEEWSPGMWRRSPVVWERGQFPLLTDAELNDQIRVFAEGKEIAREWYAAHLESKKRK